LEKCINIYTKHDPPEMSVEIKRAIFQLNKDGENWEGEEELATKGSKDQTKIERVLGAKVN